MVTFQHVIRPPTLVETVSEKLAEIVLRDLRPQGGWLPAERELSERLGVSRSVVREATRRLATQGLVEIQHGLGVRAVDRLHQPLNGSLALLIPDLADRLQALIETRLTIEPEAAAQAAQRATRAQSAALERIHQRMLEAASDEEAAEADCAFHQAVAEASGNLIYRLVLDSLAELSLASRVRTIGRVGKGTAFGHHESILEAVLARDAAAARARMHAHITAAFEDLDLPSFKGKSP